MGDRQGFLDRVNSLRINPTALDRIELLGAQPLIIPNQDGKRNSLQIYSAIATNDGYLGPDEALRGLKIFGEELRHEARETPGKHPSIDLLEQIVQSGKKERVNVFRNPSAKPIPEYLSEMLPEIVKEFGTPFYIYDEGAIVENAKNLLNLFSWVPGFKEYFAVKATPNPFLLKILKKQGFGADCSSLPELLLAEMSGITGTEIMFTSNDTPAEEFRKARTLGAIINLDDISHITIMQKACGIPETICFRYNPGPLREGNAIIGKPEEAKYGLTREQLFEAYRTMKRLGSKKFGLHTMIASNELNANYFVETAKMLFDLVGEISAREGIRFEFVNIGGGIGIPYKPEQMPVDLKAVSDGIKNAYDEKIVKNGLHPLKMFMECGRMITGPYGYLVAKVLNKKDTYKEFVGLDACMANLMRPALYNAWHGITVLGKENLPLTKIYNVTGGLCENNDQFAINRPLPLIDVGDIVVIHDTGAHGWAMGFQYNAKLRSKELLRRTNGTVVQIRRAETPEDYFGTLNLYALDQLQ